MRLDKPIKKNIRDTIKETDIEKFQVDKIPYEDEAFSSMEPVKLNSAMTDQDDEPTPE